jgi:hypothetical protein
VLKLTLSNCPFCGSKPAPLAIKFIATESFDIPCHKKSNCLESSVRCSNTDCAAKIVYQYDLGMLFSSHQDEIIKTLKEQTGQQVIKKWNRRTVLD